MNKKTPTASDMAVSPDESQSSTSFKPRVEATKVIVSKFSVFDGEIPREKLAHIDWRPIDGALLVSGIDMEYDPALWVLDVFEVMHHVHYIPSWRIRHAKYVYDQWCKAHHPSEPVSPEKFIRWFNEISVPPLSFSGKPIKGSTVVSLPVSDSEGDDSVEVVIDEEPINSSLDALTPLATSDISLAFQGIGSWSAEQWAENITRGQWAKSNGARAQSGRKGCKGSARWHPIQLALVALGRNRGDLKSFGDAFRKKEILKPWLEAWKEEEEKRRSY